MTQTKKPDGRSKELKAEHKSSPVELDSPPSGPVEWETSAVVDGETQTHTVKATQWRDARIAGSKHFGVHPEDVNAVRS